jgi:hypothetical protein
MRMQDFMALPEGAPNENRVGEMFLEGTKLIEQKNAVEVGQLVTYMVVVDVKEGKRIEYMPVMVRLEE